MIFPVEREEKCLSRQKPMNGKWQLGFHNWSQRYLVYEKQFFLYNPCLGDTLATLKNPAHQ